MTTYKIIVSSYWCDICHDYGLSYVSHFFFAVPLSLYLISLSSPSFSLRGFCPTRTECYLAIDQTITALAGILP